MSAPPGALRLFMPEGARYPQLCVQDAEGQWQVLRGVKRIEVICDAATGGVPEMRVDFNVLALSVFDMKGPPDSTLLGLAGVDDVMLEFARQEVARRLGATRAKVSAREAKARARAVAKAVASRLAKGKVWTPEAQAEEFASPVVD